MPKKVRLTPEAKIEAEMYEDAIGATPTLKRKNYTNINQPKRYYFGYLGEWAFNQLIKNIPHKWNINVSGYSDDGDFIINGKSVDVKTASKKDYKMLMFPPTQPKRDVYVGVKLNGDIAEVWGWCTYSDLKEKDFGYGLTKYIELENLKRFK